MWNRLRYCLEFFFFSSSLQYRLRISSAYHAHVCRIVLILFVYIYKIIIWNFVIGREPKTPARFCAGRGSIPDGLIIWINLWWVMIIRTGVFGFGFSFTSGFWVHCAHTLKNITIVQTILYTYHKWIPKREMYYTSRRAWWECNKYYIRRWLKETPAVCFNNKKCNY